MTSGFNCLARITGALLLSILCACGDSLGPNQGQGELDISPQVSAGNRHTCGISPTGILYCWGRDNFGERDGNLSVNFPTPRPISDSIQFLSISSGFGHSCAISADSTAYCWGWNHSGQLGSGDDTDLAILTPIDFDRKIVYIDAGYDHTCGLTADGTAFCWGWNYDRVLGTESVEENVTLPSRVNTTERFVKISVGDNFTCGITADSSAMCWGVNYNGELGIGSDSTKITTPTQVVRNEKITSVSAGDNHACALDTNNRAYCWGWNANDQLGGTTTETCGTSYPWPCSTVPLLVSDSLFFKQISAGSGHTCGISVDGMVFCWGNNFSGQLGDGSFVNRPIPASIAVNLNFVAVAAGSSHTCALDADGILFCWGSNENGQIADASGALGRSEPIAVFAW